MNITPNENLDNKEQKLAADPTGLAEINAAFEEIKKLEDEKAQEIEEAERETREEEEKPQEKSAHEEESASEEEETREEEKPAKKEKKEEKLWKIKKDKYRALAEKEALSQENTKLKQMLSESLNSGAYHYGKSAYSELEIAKESKKKAIEEGNVDALIEADMALTKVINTINDLEKWASVEEQKSSKSVEYTESQNLNSVQHEIAADWLDSHSYLRPGSSDYNQKLASKVAGFISDLDANLINNGREDAYFSEDYFGAIENYITEVKGETRKTPKKSESVAPIGSVRNSYSGSPVGKTSGLTQMTLSADERRMCANAGISEKDWLKYKLEDLKGGK